MRLRIATFGQNKPQNTDWLKEILNSKVTKNWRFYFGIAYMAGFCVCVSVCVSVSVSVS